MNDSQSGGLTIDEVLSLHEVILEHSGGEAGILNPTALEAALARPFQEVFGCVLFKTPFEKAAALAESIARHHPFVDGNKRTALMAAFLLLESLGWVFPIEAHYDDGYERIQNLAIGGDPACFTSWLQQYAAPFPY